jgi:hypothetical protein
MTEGQVPTFIPGDALRYQLVFNCRVNVESVTAAFRNEATGEEVVLTGKARMIDKPRVVGARTQVAILDHDQDSSDELATGRYRLARMEAKTYGGKTLDFDNPPEDAFLFEDEPEETELPKIARGLVEPATTFVLPEGHPNKGWFED